MLIPMRRETRHTHACACRYDGYLGTIKLNTQSHTEGEKNTDAFTNMHTHTFVHMHLFMHTYART